MMTSGAFPVKPEELTADWLTTALRNAGALSSRAAVRNFQAKALGEDKGMVGSLVRLTLAYAPDDTRAPAALVAKFSPADDARRQAIGVRSGIFEREVRFYKELASRVGVSVPACYFAAFDPETQHSVILLEDLSGEVGDDEAGCNPLVALRAMEALAVLHARWWNSPALAPLTWLRRNLETDDAMMAVAREHYGMFRDRFGDTVPEHLSPLLDRMVIEPAPVVPGPVTLVHSDASPKNMCFNDDGSVTLFDWQLAGESAPAHDLVLFLINGMTSSDRRSSQRELLSAYCNILAQRGADYPVEQCERDVRLAAMTRLRRLISVGGSPTLRALGLRTAARNIERTAAFFEDGGEFEGSAATK